MPRFTSSRYYSNPRKNISVGGRRGGIFRRQLTGTILTVNRPKLPLGAASRPAYVQWQGHTWWVRNGVGAPPSAPVPPNTWGRGPENYEILPDGKLRLTIAQVGGVWTSVELDRDGANLGYGRYRWVYDIDAVGLDPQGVLGLYIYDQAESAAPHQREIDIEVTKWGTPGESSQFWYSLHPVADGEHRQHDHPGTVGPYTSEFVWEPGRAYWVTTDGNGVVIGEHVVTEGVQAEGGEQPSMNLWLSNGTAPDNGQPITATIHSFQFTPDVSHALTPAAEVADNFADPYPWALKNGATISGGTLNLPCVTSYSVGYNGSVSDLRTSAAQIEVTEVPVFDGDFRQEALWSIRHDANNYAMIFVSGGGLSARLRQNGTNTASLSGGTFNLTTHRFWRISQSGTAVLFHTSPDGTTWNPIGGGSITTTLTSQQLSTMRHRIESGYWGAAGSGTFRVTQLNVPTTLHTGIAGTTFTIPNLTVSSNYRARVRSRNSYGASAWSAPFDFTTTAATAGLPQGVATGTLVSTNSTIETNPTARLGINTNLWEDNQTRRAGGARTLATALADMKPKILRYPGGEKADGTTFFTGTGQQPNPRLNRIGTDAWPSSDTGYWTTPTAAGTWAAGRPPYGLATFLADCAATGAEPIIVVALDGIYLAPPAGAGIRPTKAEMITNAQEMVRWCNVTNSYGVKYFEIGNEPWLVGYLGGTSNPAQYAADFADVAAAMKAIDPTIQVGANGNTEAYFDGILNTAAASIDFLTAHPYDTAGTTTAMSYATYQTATLGTAQVTAAAVSLAKQPAQHRDRIWLTVTETAHLPSGTTPETDANAINNLGSAIITAHFLAMQMNDSRLRHVMFWNTRWIHKTAPRRSWDALDEDNALLPVGQALRFLGQLSGRMVQATSGVTGIVTYASQVSADNRSSVLIINRSNSSQAGTVAMTGATTATARRLSGTGPTDTAPTVTDLGALTVTGGVTTSITCPANSVTVVDFGY
jgi:hypothetical protein